MRWSSPDSTTRRAFGRCSASHRPLPTLTRRSRSRWRTSGRTWAPGTTSRTSMSENNRPSPPSIPGLAPAPSNGAHVVHALLERGGVGHRIRQARAPAVEVDHAGERRQALVEPRRGLVLPDQLDVGGEPVDQNEVEIALAEDLVREMYVAASRVPGLRPCRECALCVDRSAFHTPPERLGKARLFGGRAPVATTPRFARGGVV